MINKSLRRYGTTGCPYGKVSTTRMIARAGGRTPARRGVERDAQTSIIAVQPARLPAPEAMPGSYAEASA